jgi:hypothetical protein
MLNMGVMPMPPANSRLRMALASNANRFLGSLTVITCPTRNCLCTDLGSPRDVGSLSTPMQ